MASRNQLTDRYRRLMGQVAEAAERSGRTAADIITVAVTKSAGPDQIRQLIDLGHQDMGESRVQQLQQRVAMAQEFLSRHQIMTPSRPAEVPEKVRWHMVGHLQRNKVKAALPLVRLVHSVDSLRLAEEIQAHAAKDDADVELLLQVNVAQEGAKQGLALPAVAHVADQILTMMHLKLRGLMTIAPMADDPEEVRPHFQRLQELFLELQTTGRYGRDFNLLSMGMSNDFEVAIECGANVLRVGRALFGEPVTATPA
ncbi:MAG: YggS family pyridoxal phosphate-dependent enzyme [Phycisphaerae bacterium]|nr:YggS family pyridoxal phosphate-dependent enzyme [Phycisphaerae bacterium]